MQHLQPNTTLQGGKYRIERVLGQGGFGITYLAQNTVFDVNVAIKEFFMKDENDREGSLVTMPNSTKTELFLGQKEKFKKEAKRMFTIKNEHIVVVHDLFEENGTAYYVMDYVDGENLAQRLKRTGKPMSEKKVREILPQILDALQTVHDAGIWHLDLKPANIMVDKAGQVKLIDFGASKQLNAQKGGATTSTAISYTNGFAPREQMEQNYDKFGPWTDLYALGATLYNLLTNQRPPLPTDIDDDMSDDKHLALPMPNVSEKMKQLILWLMKTNRMQRPQTIQVVKDFKFKEPPKEKVTSTVVSEPVKMVLETEETKVTEKKVDVKPRLQPDKPKVVIEQPKTEPSGGGNKAWIWILLLVGLFIGLLLFGIGNPRETDLSSNQTKTSSLNSNVVKISEPDGYANGHGYVDLGLPSGTKWATCNVGENSPEQYGDYFAWGETIGFNSGKTDFSWSTYKWCKGSYKSLTKYNTERKYGIVDGKTELDIEDDAAYMSWGAWRMPSIDQFEELVNSNYTITAWTLHKGVKGYKITSKENGKSIFLPAAGCRSNSSLNDAGSYNGYWSRTLRSNNPNHAFCLIFDPVYVYTYSGNRCSGQSVRPVLSSE